MKTKQSTVPFAGTETLFSIPVEFNTQQRELFINLANKIDEQCLSDMEWNGEENRFPIQFEGTRSEFVEVYDKLRRMCLSCGAELYIGRNETCWLVSVIGITLRA